MKTLRELDNAALAKAKARAAELCGDSSDYFGISENEIIAVQADFQFGEKYRQMYAILQVLEEYLKFDSLDGKMERQPLRKKLKEMLEAL